MIKLNPFLTSEVAIDLSNYSKERKTNNKAINILEKNLYDISTEKIDLHTFYILTNSIANKNFPVINKEGLSLQLNLASKELKEYQELPKERLENLTDFCVNLTKEIILFETTYAFPVQKIIN